MDEHHLDHMIRKLRPILKDSAKAESILKKYWQDKMALVWEVEDVYRAANEKGLAVTRLEAISVLETLHRHHNAQFGIRWEDITAHIEDKVLGRKLTKRELNQFVTKDLLTINR